MLENLSIDVSQFITENIQGYWSDLFQSPIKMITLVLDLSIVLFLAYKFIKATRNSRAWQLVKGIIILIVITSLSSILNLKILNFILTSFMGYGVIVLIVMFQPELRRGLEQLGSNKLTKFFGVDKNVVTRTKEDIYKIVIAVMELAKERTGALIVMQRDIKLKDIIDTGVMIGAEVSPQLLVNIFVPKTPLHDGAVVIADNKIEAAACILPLAGDKDIAKQLGTRHRAAIGISKETDAIAIVVSEETGKVSLAKDGTLIADVREEALKKILIKNIVTNRFEIERQPKEKNSKEKQENENA